MFKVMAEESGNEAPVIGGSAVITICGVSISIEPAAHCSPSPHGSGLTFSEGEARGFMGCSMVD